MTMTFFGFDILNVNTLKCASVNNQDQDLMKSDI